MNTCITCGIPFEGDHLNDVAMHLAEGPVCRFDTENGAIKSPQAIFEGGVQFFLPFVDGDRDRAERVTRTNMRSLPYWQAHPFDVLEGPIVTDEEFGAVMARMA